ncbi:MAG TPA: hypothetical protein VFG00_12955 [Acidothermaceae bacterium]|nr:hypothetical protein [Acidothermaceae bacterium]
MTNRRAKRQPISDVDEVSLVEASDPRDPFEHWLPTYAPRLPFDENARSLAKALWGRAFADWTWCLAKEVATKIPEAIEHDQSPGWVAGVLCAAAVEAGMKDPDALWDHILNDIVEMTGVDRQIAQQRWELLKAVGLDRPARPPACWD